LLSKCEKDCRHEKKPSQTIMNRTEETGLAKSFIWLRNYGNGVHEQNDAEQHPRERNIGSDGSEDRTHQHHLGQHILHHRQQIASDRLEHANRSIDVGHDYYVRRNGSISLAESHLPNVEPLQQRGSHLQTKGNT
jgi:hypothetical protein